MSRLDDWQQELQSAIIPEKQKILSSFFKSGKGQYGEGDIFLGINVPTNRAISEKYCDMPLPDIKKMLHSQLHEYRLGALLALVKRFAMNKRNDQAQKEIVDFYLANTRYINNWDLVDLSCPKIIGPYQLAHPETDILYRLSLSDDLWEKRIAIVSTWTIIRKGNYEYTLNIAPRYLDHPHDLIHKATGWMLREVGKRDKATLVDFLDRYAKQMPRTALRYAIEKFSPDERQHYMKL